MQQIGNLSAGELAQKLPSDISKAKIEQLLNSSMPVLKLSELEKIAQVLFVPSVYLTDENLVYQSEVPEIIDHRNLQDSGVSSYEYQAVIREALQARNDYIYVLQTLDQEPIPFTLTLTQEDAATDAQSISDYFQIKAQPFHAKHNDYYSSWRNILEANDILVIEKSSRKSFGSEGFCLWFDVVPVIVIFSTGQAAERRLFTMLHELVHLGLRQSVFDGYISKLNSDHKIERYCDSVAGYVIAPQDLLASCFNKEFTLEDNIIKIRKKAKASKAAIAIQLKLEGYITASELKAYLLELTNRNKQKNSNSEVRISAATKIMSHFGMYFVQSVISAMRHNTISITTAKNILGIKPSVAAKALKDIQNKVYG